MLLADNKNFENKTNKLFNDINTSVKKIEDPLALIEVLENLYSLIFLKYFDLENIRPVPQNHTGSFMDGTDTKFGALIRSMEIEDSFNTMSHEGDVLEEKGHSNSASTRGAASSFAATGYPGKC